MKQVGIIYLFLFLSSSFYSCSQLVIFVVHKSFELVSLLLSLCDNQLLKTTRMIV
uniref:Lipoprotein n=1 Tax=Rhizophora mucronata TaxID=61149 RepID=A0A2P2QRT8_RHIMU